MPLHFIRQDITVMNYDAMVKENDAEQEANQQEIKTEKSA